MNLYQWVFGHQPHYVVAESYCEAEALILEEMGPSHKIDRIECLGPYVIVSPRALERES